MRPEEAQYILNNINFQELLKLMQEELLMNLLQTDPIDGSEEREKIYQQIQLVPVLTKSLTKLANQLAMKGD